ncbi:4-hydroxy-tetrahydrodipicolinate synthase [Rhizobium sp. Root1220]|uniref:4-hydroxy-tetrahydrodipicolinate synthase n=1 Tax=Rhizobium sp. Root1220 TaxID=1736432 RepID=UPI0006FCE5AD|nr:4-hydroxy-tetrahydrodipicolinate synthase [Rhizobium sp. Root1220]KQV78689.1 4-hydroxy-tetrahydrodipicolinate synthase [Rhizobium sp. Root1220]
MRMENRLRIGATTTALITPFRNGIPDLRALRQLAERQIRAGVDGLAVCTITGEGPTLSMHERAAAIWTCVKAAAGRIPVIAATGTNATASTIALTQQAEALGAQAALVTVPYYSKPGQKGIISHFQQVGAASTLPLIIDNEFSRTASNLTVDTLKALADNPSIAGIVGSDIATPGALPADLRHRFVLLSNRDASAIAFLASGGSGVISAGANVHPRLFASLQQACRAGNMSAAVALEDRLSALMSALGTDGDPCAIKHALHVLLGSDTAVRLPLVTLEASAKTAISEALTELAHSSSIAISI